MDFDEWIKLRIEHELDGGNITSEQDNVGHYRFTFVMPSYPCAVEQCWELASHVHQKPTLFLCKDHWKEMV